MRHSHKPNQAHRTTPFRCGTHTTGTTGKASRYVQDVGEEEGNEGGEVELPNVDSEHLTQPLRVVDVAWQLELHHQVPVQLENISCYHIMCMHFVMVSIIITIQQTVSVFLPEVINGCLLDLVASSE